MFMISDRVRWQQTLGTVVATKEIELTPGNPTTMVEVQFDSDRQGKTVCIESAFLQLDPH